MKNTLKILFFFALGVLIANSAYNFYSYKMHQEIPRYSTLNEKANELTQTYALCSGLLLSNPTQQNIESCEVLRVQLHDLFDQIQEECPYIYFYTKYLQFSS